MGNAVRPQRRAILTGGLAAASAAVLTACSSKSGDVGTAKAANVGAAASSPKAAPRPDSARTAYARLLEGNKRWGSGTLQHPDQDPARRAAVAPEQKPYGVIVSCIDSRVPPELVFDTGIGDLFVIRTGGQVVQPVVVGSVEYGPLTAGSPLIVVLGHQNCGAIKAAYKAIKDDEDLPGNLQSIVEALRPAYQDIAKTKHADPVDAMIRAHANRTAADLRSNASLAPLVKKGDLSVVSAYYSLDTGRVETLTGAPSA
ncbi:carbonic anhydrase [Streptomyces caniscabiei]|uniref:Carbonic anhydrase n=1 Tax=Streptomyces caniscabiei TaxID=2746961 RepID=A0A927QEF3_9ACTN|nr:carbonic anhydrase [Streptomyces caniscabiei]MBD9723838.1 carbonic anhydrase [Streptomyces caniscabiei]MDX3511509.1 carbonic anhydrase [Streptomyces caniscabiei]MDX3718310.1 carbonic anhydrase [Streptomyces caniscabiei]WEO22275.1 carbonic anhydrase [Streptomyces caniscabiei]